MKPEEIALISSVAIASNGVISWWESFCEPLIRRKNRTAFQVLNVFVTEYSNKLAEATKRCEESIGTCVTTPSTKSLKDATKTSRRKDNYQHQWDRLSKIKLPEMDQAEVTFGIRNIMIHLIKLIAFFFVVMSMVILVFAKQIAERDFHNGYMLLLFLPQFIAFLLILWVYTTPVLTNF